MKPVDSFSRRIHGRVPGGSWPTTTQNRGMAGSSQTIGKYRTLSHRASRLAPPPAHPPPFVRPLFLLISLYLGTVSKAQLRRGCTYFARVLHVFLPTLSACTDLAQATETSPYTTILSPYKFNRLARQPTRLWLAYLASFTLQLIQANPDVPYRPLSSSHIPTALAANCGTLGHTPTTRTEPCMSACMMACTCVVSRITAAQRAYHQQPVLVTTARTRHIFVPDCLWMLRLYSCRVWFRTAPAVVRTAH